MAEPAITVETKPIPRHHPLAHKNGFELFVQLLSADMVWSDCTKPQRRVLDELCRPLWDRLLAAGAMVAEELPALPATANVATREALARRGLYSLTGKHITGKAVHAWYYAVKFQEDRASERGGPTDPGGGT